MLTRRTRDVFDDEHGGLEAGDVADTGEEGRGAVFAIIEATLRAGRRQCNDPPPGTKMGEMLGKYKHSVIQGCWTANGGPPKIFFCLNKMEFFMLMLHSGVGK